LDFKADALTSNLDFFFPLPPLLADTGGVAAAASDSLRFLVGAFELGVLPSSATGLNLGFPPISL